MALSGTQKDLLRTVIAAAKEGRYLHGNGATWVYTKKGDPKTVVVVDHVQASIKEMSPSESETYLRGNRPYKDENTAKSLENFIK